MAAAAVAAPIIAGMIANAKNQKDRAAAKSAMKDSLKKLEEVGMPPDLSQALILKEYERAGIYTPELEQDLNDSIAESSVGAIKEDPALREAQTTALQSMQQRGKVGLSAEDRAALNQVRSQVQTDSEAKRQQILQQMQSRGMGGSGAELMAQLSSSQGAADQAAAGSDTLMAQAQQRAMEALGKSSDMAGSLRGQDFDVESTKAKALDERNRFLAENSIGRQQRNVGALNQAQMLNLEEQQRIADANVNQANLEAQRQSAEKGKQWDRKLNQAGGKATADQAMAQYYTGQAQRTSDQYVGAGNAVATGVGGYANMQAADKNAALDRQAKYSDENLKNDIEYTDEDVQEWLDGLSLKVTGKKRNI